MTPPVVVLIPVLRRPHRVAPLIESLEANTPEPHRLLFLASPEDVDEQKAIAKAGAEILVVEHSAGPGDYARKINAGYRATTEPLMLLGADDLQFHPRWLTTAVDHLGANTRVIGTNDLGNPRVMKGRHSTHPVVARSYVDELGTIDELGKVLHEGYDHNFVDDELIGTAKKRRAWSFAAKSLVEHLHPHWSKAEDDEVYRKGQAHFNEDRRLFLERRRLWT